MDRSLKIAIIISMSVHFALIAAMIIGPMLLSKDMPGPGSEVQVWLTAPGASTGAATGSGSAAVTTNLKKGGLKKSVAAKAFPEEMTVPSDLAIAPLKKDDLPGEEAARKDTEAGGGGQDSGAGGLGAGSGGNPLLAQIWRQINSSKYYPSSARRRGLTGAPRITFAVTEDGKIKWVRLASTCGAKILDEAALTTVRRAAPLPYYPKPITVVVKYSLTQ